ncbi:MAG: hypothetical protein DRG78_15200 [Epsilonproteobacteria bacterium]|nr:MAG: hypothetical protein DRG78_15200 [Campylobacterota bacterium]
MEKAQRLSREGVHNTKTGDVEMVAIYYFYVLKDPRDGIIKYVGCTVDKYNRFRNHIYEAKKNNRSLKERWIVSLLRRNLQPIMKTIYIKECTLIEASKIEKMLIKSFGKRFLLKNGIDKAIGCLGGGTDVYQYSLYGEFITRFTSAGQAMIKTGVKDSNIGRCCKQKYGAKSAGGFLWSYSKQSSSEMKYDIEWRKNKGKPVRCISKNGIITEYENARKAYTETGISYKKISATCNGRQKHAGGYSWEFIIY